MTAENPNFRKLSRVIPLILITNFFRSVFLQMNLSRVLRLQQQFVNKMLSYSLRFDHILYCMDNETSVNPEWGKCWANYIHKKAKLAGKQVFWWDLHDLCHPLYAETFDNPHIFQFMGLTGRMYFFEGDPNNEILQSRGSREAWGRAVSERNILFIFPEGELELDLSDLNDEPSLVWLNVLTSEWSPEASLGKGRTHLLPRTRVIGSL